MNFFRRCGGRVRALLLGAGLGMAGLGVQATEIRVMDLRLDLAPGWVTAPAAQVDESDAWSLSLPVEGGVALEVLIPRSPPLLKSDGETFYRNLTRKWQAQHGKEVAVGWGHFGSQEAGPGATRWLIGRRPSRTGEGVVFHLATVQAGRAYSVLVIAPPGSDALPPEAQILLAGLAFNPQDVAAPLSLPIVDVAANSAAVASATSPVTTRWRRAGSRVLVPEGEVLSALAQAETEAMGDTGMLTSFVFQAQALNGNTLGAGWTLEGFRWASRFGRDQQVPFASRGRLDLTAAETWGADGRLPVTLVLRVDETETPLAAVMEARAYCGPAGPWTEAMKALEKGARAPLRRLAEKHGCPDAEGKLAIQTRWEAHGVDHLSRERGVEMPLPGYGVGVRWLEVSLDPQPGSVGDGLLERLALVLMFEPEHR
ncbi:MAG: hypothetical protein AB1421_13040 [Pseudomonadota bacterium]